MKKQKLSEIEQKLIDKGYKKMEITQQDAFPVYGRGRQRIIVAGERIWGEYESSIDLDEQKTTSY